ncbi:MAG: glycine--tRNA ligase subunit beta [Candidatus Nitronauta litoralis]|uniref:Glycine--tRNA ligase beta subunit n=1 Tax=Candidatus Nitronauta litoralis TaxID=2705533 RepID=A0A7T0BV27_9BACT|nr:MAG: glycine--tRNA ligase subunit beta [Candidatus Nitronauta litoralis]
MAELLIEIGTEEIPAGYIAPALASMAENLSGWLQKNHIKAGKPVTCGTPRRLTLCISDLNPMQDDVVEVHKGPNVKAAYDAEGNPTKAALGFARGKGLDVSELSQEDTPKGKVLCARIEKTGRPTKDLLDEYLPDWIHGIPFPKKMRWGSNRQAFVRPLHWIVAVLEGEPLSFEVEGVQAGNTTRGHRFLNPDSLTVENFEDYRDQLSKHSVSVDPEERKQVIQKQLKALAEEVGGFIKEDLELLQTVAHLVELPIPLRGQYDARYLELPVELLEITMKYHQKYFPIWETETKLLPYFVTVSNMPVVEGSSIIPGNQRVLKARLEDARFFYEEDQKKRLSDFTEALKGVVFQKDLGTLYEKVERSVGLMERLKEFTSGTDVGFIEVAKRAIRLCKADLNTQMVFEFPELQGIIGGYYALKDEGEPIATAIKEHYKPAFAGDGVPSTELGAFVALVDKLDTIVACIGVGLIPTGSEDPYALRRHAMGIIQILIEKNIPVTLDCLTEAGIAQLGDRAKLGHEEIRQHVLDLFHQRLKTMLSNEGYEYDVIDAVLASGNQDSFKILQAKTAALSELKKKDYFDSLAGAFRRVVNILEGKTYSGLDSSLFEKSAENNLLDKVRSIEEDVVNLFSKRDFSGALARIVEIRPEVDAFFDDVMVNVDDEKVKHNRKALLSVIAGLFSQIADFSKIVIKKG